MWLKIGHRGAAGYEPENTLRSIRRAISLGADVAEIDVQRTADNQLVVIHDKRVDRTTNGTGPVAQLELAELRRLDAGKGERIPTLSEVLDVAGGRIGLMLELVTPGIAAQAVEAVRGHAIAPLIFASFHHDELLAIRELLPNALTLALLEGVPVKKTAFVHHAHATHAGLAIDSITPDYVSALRAEQIATFVYTVNDERDISWLRALPIDGVISDFPDRLQPALMTG